MPYESTALTDQQALILTQMGVVNTAIDTYDTAAALQVSDPSAPHLAAQEAAAADLLVQRAAMAALIAQIPLLLFEDRAYQPATEAGATFDLIYQVAFALAPSY